MAATINSKTKGCTLQWKLKNLSCWRKYLPIVSPTYVADSLGGSKWSLMLYSKEKPHEEDPVLYLHREEDGSGNVLKLNYQLVVLGSDGLFLNEINGVYCSPGKGSLWRVPGFNYVENDCQKKPFDEDSLTLQCTIWSKGDKPVKPDLFFVTTVFHLSRRSFVWKIQEFSKKKVARYKLDDDLISFDLVLNDPLDFDNQLHIYMISFNENVKHFSFKISVINSEGGKEECEEFTYWQDDNLKKGVRSMKVLNKMLMGNECRYLPNDILSLDCEYIYSNGTALNESSNCEIISPKFTKVVVEKEKSEHIPVLGNDLKSLYADGIFSDTKLRTSTKTFPVHKIILIARSPVFKKMFSNDMKEKNSGHVDIIDLEDDTLHRMLTYIYTDSVEDLQFENACKLYTAADKYEIISLRSRCSSFLKNNLCPINACEVLALADRHQDEDLKSVVQDFILRNDKEVFGSQEWKYFMTTNLQLAADLMYRKVFPG